MYLMEHVGGVSGIRNDDFFGGTIELRRCVRVEFAACELRQDFGTSQLRIFYFLVLYCGVSLSTVTMNRLVVLQNKV